MHQMHEMHRVRVGTLRWVAGVYCALLGALVLVAPQEFRAAGYAGLWLHLSWWGGAFLVAGVGLLSAAVLRPARGVGVTAHLAAGAALFTLAAIFSATGDWAGAASNAVLGLGIAWVGLDGPGAVGHPPRSWVGTAHGPDLFAVLAGAAAVAAGLAMVAAPALTAPFAGAAYEPIRPALPWYGAAFLGCGLILLAAHLSGRVPVGARWAALLLAAGVFLAFAAAVALPGRLWASVAYYGTFGVAVALLPWLGPRLDRIDPASLRTRLALALASVAALPLILAMSLVTDRQMQVASAQALEQQRTLAAALAQGVADYVVLHRDAVTALAGYPGLGEMAPDAQRALLRAFGAGYPDLEALGTLDAAGVPVARGDDGPLAAFPGRSLYEARRTAAPAVAVVSGSGPGPMLLLGAPIVGPDGAFGGLAAGAIESDRLAALLERSGAGIGGEAYLVDARTGRVLAHPDAGLVASFADLSATPPVAELRAARGVSGGVRYGPEGGERLAGFAPVPDLDWGVVVDVPRDVALAGALAARDLALGVLLLAIAAAALVGVAIASALAAPLGRLARAANRLAEGAFPGPVPQSRITEVAHLAAAFRDLGERLAARTAERERAETALRGNEARYRELFENANDVVYTHDLAGNFTAINRAGERLFGYTRDEILAMNVADVVAPEHLELVRSMTARKVAGKVAGEATTYEIDLVVKEGRRVPVEVGSRAISIDGQPAAVQGIARDVTERRREEEARTHLIQEQAAREAERRRADQAEQLAATLARVGAASDVEGALEALVRGAMAVLGAQHGVVRLFGPAPGERPLELTIDPAGQLAIGTKGRPLPPGSFAAAIQAGGPSVLVDDFWALDPVTCASNDTMQRQGMRSAVNVPIDAGGRRIGSLHLDHAEPSFFGPTDLAFAEALAAHAGAAIERARLEAAQREAVAAREAALRQLADQTEAAAKREVEAAALRELDRLKDELLATVSHELRTPLTVVSGYAQRLVTRAHHLAPEGIATSAKAIAVSSAQLTRLVDDLLSFARIQRGEVAVQPVDFDLVPVLQEVLVGFRGQAGGERLAAELSDDASLPGHGDPVRVAQAVANLVENALKYAPEGPIVLRAGQVEQMIRVEVIDQGPGVLPAEQPRVWEKFYRGSGVAGLNLVRGSGIGLAVVKALVEAQGGRVGLVSTPGAGACFWLDLPAANSGSSAPPGARAA